MLDGFSKIGQIAIPGVGLVIAFLVYRLNSQKLFLDMLKARRDAVHEVFAAAAACQAEAGSANLVALGIGTEALAEQSRFWRAKETAEGLFGEEVGAKLNALETALRMHSLAVFGIRGPGANPADFLETNAAYNLALEQIDVARSGLAIAVRVYTDLGRRGIPTLSRMAIWFRWSVVRRG